MKVAFLGLGVMGYPMAGHLAKNGHAVTVFNRTTSRAEDWVKEYGGALRPTPAEAAAEAEIVFACVGNDDDLRAVVNGPQGAFAGMQRGAIFADHTTASAAIARDLYQLAKERGIGFLDAPVSGGQAGAQNGKLTIMVGGDDAVFAKTQPVMAHYGRAVSSPRWSTRSPSPACCRGCPRPSISPPAPDSTAERWSKRSPRARRNRGKWTIARSPCSMASSTSALPSTGCARISAFA